MTKEKVDYKSLLQRYIKFFLSVDDSLDSDDVFHSKGFDSHTEAEFLKGDRKILKQMEIKIKRERWNNPPKVKKREKISQ